MTEPDCPVGYFRGRAALQLRCQECPDSPTTYGRGVRREHYPLRLSATIRRGRSSRTLIKRKDKTPLLVKQNKRNLCPTVSPSLSSCIRSHMSWMLCPLKSCCGGMSSRFSPRPHISFSLFFRVWGVRLLLSISLHRRSALEKEYPFPCTGGEREQALCDSIGQAARSGNKCAGAGTRER